MVRESDGWRGEEESDRDKRWVKRRMDTSDGNKGDQVHVCSIMQCPLYCKY